MDFNSNLQKEMMCELRRFRPINSIPGIGVFLVCAQTTAEKNRILYIARNYGISERFEWWSEMQKNQYGFKDRVHGSTHFDMTIEQVDPETDILWAVNICAPFRGDFETFIEFGITPFGEVYVHVPSVNNISDELALIQSNLLMKYSRFKQGNRSMLHFSIADFELVKQCISDTYIMMMSLLVMEIA